MTKYIFIRDKLNFVFQHISKKYQSRLRNRCSALNSDLYRANLIPNALCSFGKSDETAKYFLSDVGDKQE
jgi:hypothetical protein